MTHLRTSHAETLQPAERLTSASSGADPGGIAGSVCMTGIAARLLRCDDIISMIHAAVGGLCVVADRSRLCVCVCVWVCG